MHQHPISFKFAAQPSDSGRTPIPPNIDSVLRECLHRHGLELGETETVGTDRYLIHIVSESVLGDRSAEVVRDLKAAVQAIEHHQLQDPDSIR